MQYWEHLSGEIKSYCEENGIKYTNYFYHEKLVKKGQAAGQTTSEQ